eukprot:3002965-Amphidinium_carterae.1
MQHHFHDLLACALLLQLVMFLCGGVHVARFLIDDKGGESCLARHALNHLHQTPHSWHNLSNF